MAAENYRSEIRPSTIRELLEKVKKQAYSDYLAEIRLERIRQFKGAQIRFAFPVTALIGPNGSGKSRVLGAASCIYEESQPLNIFRKGRIGDEAMDDWLIEYELVSKAHNAKGTVKGSAEFKGNRWRRSGDFNRSVKLIGIGRTVPAGDNPG